MSKMSEKMLRLLCAVRDGTDLNTDMHRAGVVTGPGITSTGSTIRALQRRRLVRCTGLFSELDGDGYTVREDVPGWVVTESGRCAIRSELARTLLGKRRGVTAILEQLVKMPLREPCNMTVSPDDGDLVLEWWGNREDRKVTAYISSTMPIYMVFVSRGTIVRSGPLRHPSDIRSGLRWLDA